MTQKPLVLIVEDEKTQQEYMRYLLQRLGFQADIAGSVQEAIQALSLALANRNPYGLILLDIMLPDGTGHDLLLRLRQDTTFSEYKFNNFRVIMVTGMDDLKHIAGAFAEECDAYVTKPVKEDTLIELLKKFHYL